MRDYLIPENRLEKNSAWETFSIFLRLPQMIRQLTCMWFLYQSMQVAVKKVLSFEIQLVQKKRVTMWHYFYYHFLRVIYLLLLHYITLHRIFTTMVLFIKINDIYMYLTLSNIFKFTSYLFIRLFFYPVNNQFSNLTIF